MITLSQVKSDLKDFTRLWNEFWFCSVDLRKVSLFRQLFGAAVLMEFAIRWFYFDTFYTENGIANLEQSQHIFGGRFFAFYFWFPQSQVLAHGMYGVLMLSLLLLTLGVKPRLFAFIAFIFHIIFLQRNYMIAYGADKVTSCWLLYLTLCASNAKVKSPEPLWSTDLFVGIGVRLIQVHLVIIYFYSGLEKLRGLAWWSGTALWAILTHQDFVFFDFTFLAYVPIFVVLGSYFGVLYELFFPVAVLFPRIKSYWLAAGLFFHATIGVLMNLPFFSFLMVLPYLLFTRKTIRARIK